MERLKQLTIFQRVGKILTSLCTILFTMKSSVKMIQRVRQNVSSISNNQFAVIATARNRLGKNPFMNACILGASCAI